MIKKFLIALMVLVVALAVVACGGDPDVTIGGDDQTNPPQGEHTHAYEEEITLATCTTVGKIVSKCACGDVQSEVEIPLAEHTASALDCEADTVCTVCGAVLAEKTGHTVTSTEVVTAATCSAPGKEKGVCVTCSKVVEKEIPTTGHVLAADGAISVVDGGFSITCASCSQKVTLKAQDPSFLLTFEEDVATEAAKYSELGLEIHTPGEWAYHDNGDGTKALGLVASKPVYINISEPAKLSSLGTFLISFDYMSTRESADGDSASVISFLGNFYDGKQTDAGTTAWGWLIKLVEAKNVLSTVKEASATTAENSIAIERNTKYNVQIVVVPDARVAHVFINGTYIGNSAQIPTVSKSAAKNLSIRFGDGPNCGHVFDNFAISELN